MKRGDIWLADLDPVVGHEQAGTRPALIISADQFNALPDDLITVISITSKQRRVPSPSRLRIAPPEGGLRLESWAICEQVRTVSKKRLIKRMGSVTPATLQAVSVNVRILLDL